MKLTHRPSIRCDREMVHDRAAMFQRQRSRVMELLIGESWESNESELRRVQMESLQWLIKLARRAGVQRIVVNGSFVTDKLEPNDVDCVLLIGAGFTRDEASETDLLNGLPFINMELVDQDGFEQFTEKTFATDRDLVPKGMIEVVP